MFLSKLEEPSTTRHLTAILNTQRLNRTVLNLLSQVEICLEEIGFRHVFYLYPFDVPGKQYLHRGLHGCYHSKNADMGLVSS